MLRATDRDHCPKTDESITHLSSTDSTKDYLARTYTRRITTTSYRGAPTIDYLPSPPRGGNLPLRCVAPGSETGKLITNGPMGCRPRCGFAAVPLAGRGSISPSDRLLRGCRTHRRAADSRPQNLAGELHHLHTASSATGEALCNVVVGPLLDSIVHTSSAHDSQFGMGTHSPVKTEVTSRLINSRLARAANGRRLAGRSLTLPLARVTCR